MVRDPTTLIRALRLGKLRRAGAFTLILSDFVLHKIVSKEPRTAFRKLFSHHIKFYEHGDERPVDRYPAITSDCK